VLACGLASFVITLFVLQWFSRPGMVVQEVKFFPYIKHFLVFVVVSHLVLAAIYFAVGTLTRNAKLVYALGFCFYPIIITYGVFFLKGNLAARFMLGGFFSRFSAVMMCRSAWVLTAWCWGRSL